jgi:hypothetical protein
MLSENMLYLNEPLLKQKLSFYSYNKIYLYYKVINMQISFMFFLIFLLNILFRGGFPTTTALFYIQEVIFKERWGQLFERFSYNM